MILRARRVLTMDGEPLVDGAVRVRGERIADVGHGLVPQADEEVIDLGDSILLPGLINAHCHLDYTAMRGAIPRLDSFTAWIRAINAQKAAWTEDDYLRSIASGLEEAAQFGTTTIANLEAFPQLIARAPNETMRLRWFAEMIDVRTPAILPNGCHLAPHAPYTASAALYQQTAARLCDSKLRATTHLAESREEMAMFHDAAGPLFEFMREIGRPMSDCGRQTPLALLLSYGALDERWLVAHLNELSGDDFALLERAPKFHIVHCPRSHAYFRHAPFAYARLRDLGFNIVLGTDSLASNDDLSLFAEMRAFAAKTAAIDAGEIVAMVTTRAAAALGEADTLGRIRSGFLADMIAIPYRTENGSELETVLNFNGRVAWRMLHGKGDLPR